MADIAQAVGVSKNAVSLALANKPGVSEKMRDKIIKTARLLGYASPAEKGNEKGCLRWTYAFDTQLAEADQIALGDTLRETLRTFRANGETTTTPAAERPD